MKKIETLVEDIEKVFLEHHIFDDEKVAAFGKKLAETIARRINPTDHAPSLRMSNLGTKCNRKLWYGINTPKDGEALPFEARVKFLFGDILEELLLFLAEEAGHTVEGTQSEVYLDGVKGHRDAVIDGMVVDCKSASSFSFKKFKSGLKPEEDAFGYLEQLNGYLQASQDDPSVTEKDRAAFLVIDKQLGHITLDVHRKSNMDYQRLIKMKRDALALPVPPPRGYSDEKEGASGNRKLGTACGYCSFKAKCWPGLRTFLYARGPSYLTVVEREPDVKEA